jgi:LPS O-antigen subunit length determinant protein (WzzB/FepE family)
MDEYNQLSSVDQAFISRYGWDAYRKYTRAMSVNRKPQPKSQPKPEPQETEESQSLSDWSSDTAKELEKVVKKEWHLEKITNEKILNQEKIRLKRLAEERMRQIEESYPKFKTILQSQVDSAINTEIAKLNSQKVNLDLQFNEDIQKNLTEFLQPISEACVALSTRQAKQVVLTFMVTKKNQIKMLVHYD